MNVFVSVCPLWFQNLGKVASFVWHIQSNQVSYSFEVGASIKRWKTRCNCMLAISKQWNLAVAGKKTQATTTTSKYNKLWRQKKKPSARIKYEMKIKIHFNTNDGHLSAAQYHTTGETIIQTWIACRVFSVPLNRNIYLANGSAISCLHENELSGWNARAFDHFGIHWTVQPYRLPNNTQNECGWKKTAFR